jgi:hypothetical protein
MLTRADEAAHRRSQGVRRPETHAVDAPMFVLSNAPRTWQMRGMQSRILNWIEQYILTLMFVVLLGECTAGDDSGQVAHDGAWPRSAAGTRFLSTASYKSGHTHLESSVCHGEEQ